MEAGRPERGGRMPGDPPRRGARDPGRTGHGRPPRRPQMKRHAPGRGRAVRPSGGCRSRKGQSTAMSMLDRVNRPADLRGLDADQLKELCGDIRDFLIRKVSATGGHLGPNLGVVELTVALHRVFDSPRDPLVFDTGHQSYVHKILTGRGGDSFDGLRSRGGLSGYPSRAESEHDIVESSHATASSSYADGLAKAYSLRGESDRAVAAAIGDGAMTGGMCWEGPNNIASGSCACNPPTRRRWITPSGPWARAATWSVAQSTRCCTGSRPVSRTRSRPRSSSATSGSSTSVPSTGTISRPPRRRCVVPRTSV